MIIPKLDYLITDDIYIGAFITMRKKNNGPIVYTDVNGQIIGTNNQAIKALGEKSRIKPSSLFLMFPRLFQMYFPDLKNGLEQPLPTSDNTVDKHPPNGIVHNIADAQVQVEKPVMTLAERNEMMGISGNLEKEEAELMADNNLYHDYHQGSSYSNVNMDFFHFPMFSATSAKIDTIDVPRAGVEDEESDTDEPKQQELNSITSIIPNEPRDRWRSVKHHLKKGKGTFVQTGFKMVSKIMDIHRKRLLENMSKVFRVKANIETQYYQRNACIREIGMTSMRRPGNTTLQFFKVFAESRSPLLLDALMLSPDSLMLVFKLAYLFVKIRTVERSYSYMAGSGIHANPTTEGNSVKYSIAKTNTLNIPVPLPNSRFKTPSDKNIQASVSVASGRYANRQ